MRKVRKDGRDRGTVVAYTLDGRNVALELLAVVEAAREELSTRDPYHNGDLPGLREAVDALDAKLAEVVP